MTVKSHICRRRFASNGTRRRFRLPVLLLSVSLLASLPRFAGAQVIDGFGDSNRNFRLENNSNSVKTKNKAKPKPTPPPHDAERDWANIGTNFNTGGNWVGGTVPGPGDVAWFKTVEVKNPNLTSSVSIAGFFFQSTGSSGYDITRNTNKTFTLTGTASNTSGTENSNSTAAAIGANNTSGMNTIDVPIILGAAANSTQTFAQATGGTLIVNGVISNANSNVTLNLTGGGIVQFNGANTYTGATNVAANGGTLNASATGALGHTSSITVNSGGTLLLSGSGNLDRVNNSAGINLNGGTFARTGTAREGTGAAVVNGIPIGGANSVGLGALTLNSTSTLDFGTGGVGTLVFTSFTPNGHTLNILNYINSNANPATNTSGVDGNDDRLIFNQDESGNLSSFSFGGLSAIEIALGGGFWEITAVPEPSTWAAGALALVGLLTTQRRRVTRLLKRS